MSFLDKTVQKPARYNPQSLTLNFENFVAR